MFCRLWQPPASCTIFKLKLSQTYPLMLQVTWFGASEPRERVSCCRSAVPLLIFADPRMDDKAEST